MTTIMITTTGTNEALPGRAAGRRRAWGWRTAHCRLFTRRAGITKVEAALASDRQRADFSVTPAVPDERRRSNPDSTDAWAEQTHRGAS